MSTHLVLWTVSLGVSLAVRFDGEVPGYFAAVGLRVLPVLLLLRAATFWRAGLFHGILRYAGMSELRAILSWTTAGTLLLAVTGMFVHRLALPRSIYFLEWLTSLAAAGGLRFLIRVVTERSLSLKRLGNDAPAAMLLGAGDAGELLLRDLERSPNPAMRIVTILDDDSQKFGSLLHGVRVHGPIDRATLQHAVEIAGTTRAILAMPTAPGVRTREIFATCRELGISLKTLPSLQRIADGGVRVSLLRDVAIEDLLRRESVMLDKTALPEVMEGRRILVTGAAGSIGSELVRQIATLNPASIALVDHNENGLFFLERELREMVPSLRVEVAVADVRDDTRIRQIFDSVQPHLVYHAAAHKHVPLMEQNPGEAIRNNVLGTVTVANAAGDFGCDAFVMISTDKAVNPTSVMGATKRVAEMYVQSLTAVHPGTRFTAVRFGNVLGSAGSVVPIFRAQIEAGGPVRVTHPEMRRFFMTIPEACQLVLQAGALGRGGEIFILDMGEPVKIVDLARDMIILSGLKPDIDIKIEFSGARPGEKLFEELLLNNELAAATEHPKIHMARIAPQRHDVMRPIIDRLDRLTRQLSDGSTIRAELATIVPEATLGSVPPPAPEPGEVVGDALPAALVSP